LPPRRGRGGVEQILDLIHNFKFYGNMENKINKVYGI
jgi:hypothetical protein